MHDWSAMGLIRKKETAPLHRVCLEDFQQAVDWMKRCFANKGYMILDVRLDADLGLWLFRVQDEVLIRVEHDLVARAQASLEAIGDHVRGQENRSWQM